MFILECLVDSERIRAVFLREGKLGGEGEGDKLVAAKKKLKRGRISQRYVTTYGLRISCSRWGFRGKKGEDEGDRSQEIKAKEPKK